MIEAEHGVKRRLNLDLTLDLGLLSSPFEIRRKLSHG
jgi:hypothetical protein